MNSSRPPTPATGRSSLPKRQERMQSQPMSSAGSPRWASSQSITAARPSSSTMKLPRRKSPWTSRGSAGTGELARSQRSPSSTAGSGSPISSSWRSHSSIWARAGSPSTAGSNAPQLPKPAVEWIRASASPSWAVRRARACSNSGLRRMRGATEVPFDEGHQHARGPEAAAAWLGQDRLGNGDAGLMRLRNQRELVLDRDQRHGALRVAAEDPPGLVALDQPGLPRGPAGDRLEDEITRVGAALSKDAADVQGQRVGQPTGSLIERSCRFPSARAEERRQLAG